MRARLGDLAPFERYAGDRHRTTSSLAVKKFSRTITASETQPADLRPLPVLRLTLRHLARVMDDTWQPPAARYDFFFDRSRALRQDLSMQRIRGREAVPLYEAIVRFHILAAGPEFGGGGAGGAPFDAHLNLQQLSKALGTLLDVYAELAARPPAQRGGRDPVPDAGEFSSYYLLLNIGNHGDIMPVPLPLWLPAVPAPVLQSPHMAFSRAVLRCYRQGNYTGFFRLARMATYLQACLLHLYLPRMRIRALAAMNNGGYKAHPPALSDLADLLLMEDEDEMEELCRHLGLPVGRVDEQRVLLVKEVVLREGTMDPPQMWSKAMLVSRGALKISDIILDSWAGEGEGSGLSHGSGIDVAASKLSTLAIGGGSTTI